MPGPAWLDLRPVLPALVVALTGVVVLLAQAFTPRERRAPAAGLALFGLLGAALLTVQSARQAQTPPELAGVVVADAFAVFLHLLILGVAALAVLLCSASSSSGVLARGEPYALLLFAVVGMLGLVSARELISIFVALEIMSVAVYALTGLRREDGRSQEAALKYFVTGAFSSAFFLYGVALLYGTSGSTRLSRVASAVSEDSSGLALLGAALLMVGLAFKVASVPFHSWAPDVYEGAPTVVTAFMAAGVKSAGFAVFLRLFVEALPSLAARWQPAVACLALASMLVGNLAALAQTNVKRMLAWSSVAHAGYLLVGAMASSSLAVESTLFYLVGYAAVSLGSFGALAALGRDGREPLGLDDLAGLAHRRPALAAALTVFLVSLTGIPVSVGFVGKFHLFRSAVEAGYLSLAVVGVLMSVVSAAYYLRVVVVMYMRAEPTEDGWPALRPAAVFSLAVSVLLVLGLGVYPGPLLDAARQAARSLASL